MPSPDVIVVGAGPAGLAVSGALRERGLRPVLLERGERAGASWDGHYDRLRLHTPRGLSGLPGLPIPRRFGRWVSRADFATYLRQYAAAYDLDIRTDANVVALERVDGEWTVRTADGATERAPFLVLATGFNDRPVLPDWPGVDSFAGELLHAADYRNPERFVGREVLVVGVGNTGAEIAADLAESGVPVSLAVRTPPHIMRRDTLGWPAQASSIGIRRLPVRLVDVLAGGLERLQTPDLSDFGLPRPEKGLYTRANEGAIPVLDSGIVQAIKEQRVQVVPAVERIFGEDVILRGGRRIQPEVILAATGYRPSLVDIDGADTLIDGDRPMMRGSADRDGAFALGFTPTIAGMVREIRLDAGRIAARIRRLRAAAEKHSSG